MQCCGYQIGIQRIQPEMSAQSTPQSSAYLDALSQAIHKKLVLDFKHLNLDFHLMTDENGKKKLKIDAWFGSRKTFVAIRTALSHVENLITGVTRGYRYKMRFVYAHFPINASITNSNKSIEIRNFLGEKKVRKVDMLQGVSVARSEKAYVRDIISSQEYELECQKLIAHFKMGGPAESGMEVMKMRKLMNSMVDLSRKG